MATQGTIARAKKKEEISYGWSSRRYVERHLDTYARFMARVFEAPPWSFNWHELVETPDHPDSPHSFLQMCLRNGAVFTDARDKNGDLAGYVMGMESLSADSLSGDYADLVTYGDAEAGNGYVAGIMVRQDLHGHGIGGTLTSRLMDRIGGQKRCLLRTQRAAVGVMRITEKLGMRVYRDYRFAQAGQTLDRVMIIRDEQ